ncbi:AMP-binding enzyme, putative [marine gamma proteobacterium HTCC2148]|jgi:long-chain acyl-CoA synthetase|nr:AMP-binding enzyme, putative [marine gamma proteobacterium HTCC2148]MBT3410534.1 AMP-binding protein [Halieaceae bacterium]MBT5006731.1 AMP-binding protein [Halieaceae bacterium]MBT6126395.1 AMP-binding protein [Halieaceae bacterium]MBT7720770.1 AMP-binding protein [Halieaceae bacterium]
MLNSIGQIPAEAARCYGDRVALIVPDRELTFNELEALTNRCANALVALGVQPGDRVTLYSGNCWEWVVSYYGALKVGAVINPINVMLTPGEVEFVANDCGASIVIASHEKALSIAGVKEKSGVRELIAFGDEAMPEGMLSFNEILAASDVAFEVADIDPDSLSTIGYTSGTTGHPKGACLSHRNILLNVAMTALMHQRSDRDTVVTALPCPHVYGNVIMSCAIQNGSTLVLHPAFEEATILQSIQDHKATRFEGVPTMYMFLLNHPQLVDYDLSSLCCCTVGGQTMPKPKMEEVEARFGCPLIEVWGMTELGGLGTTFAANGPIKKGSIGVPIPYVQARIADTEDAGKTLPPGEVGELMIKGGIVMQGYYGNEQATRESIEPDGWLHTGDVASMDEDGCIFIVDRKKDMILTAGFNVYPAEIERVAAGHPDVALVAVGSIPDEAKGELAKAYIVPKTGATPDADDIIAYCREHLAAYKVPRAVQFVDDLPKTSTGKVMRRELKTLD